MRAESVFRERVPGPVFAWVKRASWLELAIFAALVVFWLAPGFHREEFVFGLSHGIGYLALCAVIWVAILRKEAPYILLAATLTPVGPVGSVIAIRWIERRADGSRLTPDGRMMQNAPHKQGGTATDL